ncbi:MAG: lysylphosphatidylglycerol synthase transmembrane domain-containing protein [Deltaproteobacteria bacterium]
MRKKGLITWLGIALSVALLAWIVTKFDMKEALDALARANPAWLVAGAVVYAGLFALRGWRWALLLKPIKKVSAGTAGEVFAIGFMANNILPARLGDVARAFVLARREGITAAGSFSSVMLERILDGVVVVLFLNVVLWVDPPAAPWIGKMSLIASAIFVGAVVVCGLIAWNERPVLTVAKRALFFASDSLKQKVFGLIVRLAEGLHSLKSLSRTLEVIALSLLIWTIETSVYVLAGYAYGLEVPVLGMALVMSVLTLGLSVPSGPGFVGVFEGLIIQAVGLYGIVGPDAVAYALSVHMIHFVPGTLLGLAFSWRSGLKLSELGTAAEG